MLRPALWALIPALLVAQAPKSATKPAAKPAAAKAPAATAPAPQDPVLARIGDRTLRASDLDLFLSLTLNPQQRMQMELVEGAKGEYQKQFLELQLMAAKARKDGLNRSQDFRRRMELMELQVLVQELMQREGPALQAKMKLGEEAPKAYYDQHPDKFRSKGSFSVRHLLVPMKGARNAPEDALPEAEAKARALQAKAELEGGKSWDEVAKAFSTDPGSKDKGGLYENIDFGNFVPPFEEAVRTQALGKPGEPVRTDFGFHVIQVENRKDPELQPFEAVKEQAQQMAQVALQESVLQAYLDGLKKEIPYRVGDAAKAPAAAPKSKGGSK